MTCYPAAFFDQYLLFHADLTGMGRSLALSEIMDKGQYGHSGLIFSQDPYTMMHMVKMLVIEVMRNATSKVGQHLNLPLLAPYNPAHRPI